MRVHALRHVPTVMSSKLSLRDYKVPVSLTMRRRRRTNRKLIETGKLNCTCRLEAGGWEVVSQVEQEIVRVNREIDRVRRARVDMSRMICFDESIPPPPYRPPSDISNTVHTYV